jgi:hypothetical protein
MDFFFSTLDFVLVLEVGSIDIDLREPFTLA